MKGHGAIGHGLRVGGLDAPAIACGVAEARIELEEGDLHGLSLAGLAVRRSQFSADR